LKEDLIDLPNGDEYIESFKEKIHPEWIEANRLCNLTSYDDDFYIVKDTMSSLIGSIEMESNSPEFISEEVDDYESNPRLYSLKHTGSIPYQRKDKPIVGLPGIIPGKRIPLSFFIKL
jgi:hypothetical protein